METLNVTVLAKTCLVRTKTEFNFITTVYRHTQYTAGTMAPMEAPIEQWDLDLLPLTIWPTDVSLATVWVSWLLMECP